MLRDFPALPFIKIPVVDVRDVAEAHLRALEVEEAVDQRFALVSQCVYFTELGQWRHEKYAPNYDVPTAQIPKCLIWFAAFFSKQAENGLKSWGKEI